MTANIGNSPTKFEIWFRKRKPGDTWTLQSMNEEIKNAWTDEISKLLWNQAKRNRGTDDINYLPEFCILIFISAKINSEAILKIFNFHS